MLIYFSNELMSNRIMSNIIRVNWIVRTYVYVHMVKTADKIKSGEYTEIMSETSTYQKFKTTYVRQRDNTIQS